MKTDTPIRWVGTSPAKINLYLAITGRREDGFHDLVSLVAQTQFGDDLTLRFAGESDALSCDHPNCPTGASNLILRAIAAYRQEVPSLPPVEAKLTKQIPIGAGLGGGSSNAACTLRALNELMSHPLSSEQLASIAAKLGSDCPLFLQDRPIWMRGRGERLSAATRAVESLLHNQRVVIFKPSFGIETPWAYRQIAAAQIYSSPAEVEAYSNKIHRNAECIIDEDGFNAFEKPIFAKHLSYEPLFQELRSLGLRPLLSGSGSACFCIIPKTIERNTVLSVIYRAWGPDGVVAETTLA